MSPQGTRCDIFGNPRARRTPFPKISANDQVLQFHRSLPQYLPTPLIDLPHIADRLGVARVYLKDESWRLGLPSFKMLGASWATAHAVKGVWVDDPESIHTLHDLRRALSRPWTKRLVAATDGNHGRGVARMAKYLGMKCLIFVPRGLAVSRIWAIRSEGARVRIVDGSYDDAIARSSREANESSLVVSDTSWEGYKDIPEQVTVGYSTLFREIDKALARAKEAQPTLVALQAGVGSFAAAGMLHYRSAGRTSCPRTAVVEPESANCLFRSAEAGEVTEAPPPHHSTMAGLNCGLPSQLTWPLLDQSVDFFCAIPDSASYDAMKLLAEAGVVAGESGAAGLGGLLAVGSSGASSERELLGLDSSTRVLLVNTEGATDPRNYRRVVGCSARTVARHREQRRLAVGAGLLGQETEK